MARIGSALGCVAIFAVIGLSNSYEIITNVSDVSIKIGEISPQILNITGDFKESSGIIYLKTNHKDLVEITPNSFLLNSTRPPWHFCIKSLKPGHDVLSVVTQNVSNVPSNNAFIRLTLLRSYELVTTSAIIGWLYFAAWSVSFYPQLYENWKRKSVVGLNFDFLALNMVGFILYSLYNCGLHWIPAIQEEYYEHYPKGLIPVQMNDIVFSLHAVTVTLLTILQCFIYERGEQRVSLVAIGILGVFGVVFMVAFILPWTKAIGWLMFLNICGYIKLTITLIKYIPQAYMNYTRKSTVGWSIGNVLLDFTGGMLSMVQMMINADNYDDWDSIFGDITKFGLGLFSVVFDIFFVLQHYVFYRSTGYSEIGGETAQIQTETTEPSTNESDIE